MLCDKCQMGDTVNLKSIGFFGVGGFEVVAIYSSFTAGEMALSSNSFTSVLMVIAKSLKMFQCIAINAAPQLSNLSLLLSCTLGRLSPSCFLPHCAFCS